MGSALAAQISRRRAAGVERQRVHQVDKRWLDARVIDVLLASFVTPSWRIEKCRTARSPFSARAALSPWPPGDVRGRVPVSVIMSPC
ncbi:hypothetical protein ACFFMR_20480 [Micromonospora andamanensis]|uniref:hypothetical protein n=1 Tax=Micromonospora andamanensis TaxID=1287068 RepID=UPI001951B2CD|nr:hypothetical protein [Micromonospora andamanensis]